MSANEEVEVKIVEEVFVDGQLAELVIIEEFAKRGERSPHAKIYVIRIDKLTCHVHKPNPTGEELLHLAGKTSAGYSFTKSSAVTSLNLDTPAAVRAVAECDVIFGCVDTAEGRNLANRIAPSTCNLI